MDDRERFLLEDDLDGIDAIDVDMDDDSEAMDDYIADDVDTVDDVDFDALERDIDALGGGNE